MKVYVASSWRNEKQPEVVEALRDAGHEVYDFQNPTEAEYGFHWSWIDPDWQSWTPEQFREALDHPVAVKGFGLDAAAMDWSEATVLVMPCGRSAHLELGHALGAGKLGIILLSDGEPELMYRLSHHLCVSIEEVVEKLEEGVSGKA